jgi:hypothetical protein
MSKTSASSYLIGTPGGRFCSRTARRQADASKYPAKGIMMRKIDSFLLVSFFSLLAAPTLRSSALSAVRRIGRNYVALSVKGFAFLRDAVMLSPTFFFSANFQDGHTSHLLVFSKPPAIQSFGFSFASLAYFAADGLWLRLRHGVTPWCAPGFRLAFARIGR